MLILWQQKSGRLRLLFSFIVVVFYCVTSSVIS